MRWFPAMCHARLSSLVFFFRDVNSIRWLFTDCSDRRIHWYFKINAVHVLQNTKKYIWVHIRVLWSSFPLRWKPNILLVNYDRWWQHQMSVRELRHDRPGGRFSKSRSLSASVSFLSSPPPPCSFIYAIFRAVFDSRSSFFAPKPHGNACYAGYEYWIYFFSL